MIISRDLKREEARTNNLENTWNDYRKLRNVCTNMVRKDRNRQYNEMYNDINTRKDTKDLYKQTKALLG